MKIESYLEFSAPLIENIYIKKLYTERRPLHGSEDLDGFIVDCAQNFSKKALQLSFGRGKDGILYERQWQMEFYRVATSVLPERHGISADVGKIFDADGLIDFYINGQLQWGIELLREGSNADEHAKRFKEGGKYWPMKNRIKAYALVDCRSDIPVLKDNFWYLVHNDDFETIHRKGKKSVIVKIK